MEQVRTWVLTAGAVVLALMILATLVRAVLGPRFTDRIVAVNVISTLVIAELVLLSVWLREDFLVDVALVFALLSFLAVVVVSRLVAAGNARSGRRREETPMIDNLVTAAGLACFLFGLFVFFSAVLGLFRFDYVLNRMHAAAVGDSLGIFCVLIGLMLLHGWSLSAAKTLLIFVFLWLTSPVCSHLVAEMEVSTVPDLEKECEVEVR